MGPTDNSSEQRVMIRKNDDILNDDTLNEDTSKLVRSFLKLLPDLTFSTKDYREDKQFMDILEQTYTNTNGELPKKVKERQQAYHKSKERIETLENQGVTLVNELLTTIGDVIKNGVSSTFEAYGSHIRNELDSKEENINKKYEQLKQESDTLITNIKNSTNSQIMGVKNTHDKEISTLKGQIIKILGMVKDIENDRISSTKSAKEYLQKLETQYQTSENQYKMKLNELTSNTGLLQEDIKQLKSQINGMKAPDMKAPKEWNETIEKVNQGYYLVEKLQEHLFKVEKDVQFQDRRSKELEPIVSAILRSNQQGISEEHLEKSRTLSNAKLISQLNWDVKDLKISIEQLQTKYNFKLHELKRKFDTIPTSSKLSLNKDNLATTNNNINNENNSLTNGPPLKRTRITNSSSIDSSDNNDESTIVNLQKSLEQVNIKLDDLRKYIAEFEPTVLNPNFPNNLEKHVQEVQSFLNTHNHVLSLLMDPIGSTKNLINDSSTKQNGSSEKEDDEQLQVSPAMIIAIKKMIDYETELQIEPLKTRIKELEDQLKNNN